MANKRMSRRDFIRASASLAAGLPRRYRDLLDQLGELRTPAGIGHGLLALDLLPLAMAGHHALLRSGSRSPCRRHSGLAWQDARTSINIEIYRWLRGVRTRQLAPAPGHRYASPL